MGQNLRIEIYTGNQAVPVYTDTMESNLTVDSTSNANSALSTGEVFQNTLDEKMSLSSLASDYPELQKLIQSLESLGATEQEAITVPTELESIFRKAAETYGIDEGILIAMAKQESNFNTGSTSSAGAMGVLQLMPSTAANLGVTNAYDAEQNIMAGAQLLASYIEKYDGNVSLALAAYSAGSGSVSKYEGIPDYTETQNHIPKVLSYYARGYVTSDGSTSSTPSASDVLSLISQYNKTPGSATGTGSDDLNESQKASLSNLMMQGAALVLREQLTEST